MPFTSTLHLLPMCPVEVQKKLRVDYPDNGTCSLTRHLTLPETLMVTWMAWPLERACSATYTGLSTSMFAGGGHYFELYSYESVGVCDEVKTWIGLDMEVTLHTQDYRLTVSSLTSAKSP